MKSTRHSARRDGFTLLEVILAMTILAGAMAVLGEVSRLALKNAAEARDLARAQVLAESKMAEIESGVTTIEDVDKQRFDTSTDAVEQGQRPWVYSISSDAADETGLLSVRVTVTRDAPAAQHPVKFALVHWLPDPSYTYSPPPSDASVTASGGT